MRGRHFLSLVVILVLVAAAYAARNHSSTTATPTTVPSGPTHGGALAYSTASASVVQAQPRPGSCHAIGTGDYVEPDPKCTPGALNPAVKPSTIYQTICSKGWTSTVRPSSSITGKEKKLSMAAYGYTGSTRNYEYDHLVSLELGGAVNAARNLWPETGSTPNPKDKVENQLNHAVCDHQMSLAQAQHIISTEWLSYYNAHDKN